MLRYHKPQWLTQWGIKTKTRKPWFNSQQIKRLLSLLHIHTHLFTCPTGTSCSGSGLKWLGSEAAATHTHTHTCMCTCCIIENKDNFTSNACALGHKFQSTGSAFYLSTVCLFLLHICMVAEWAAII